MGGVGSVDEVVQVVSVRRVGMHARHLIHQKLMYHASRRRYISPRMRTEGCIDTSDI